MGVAEAITNGFPLQGGFVLELFKILQKSLWVTEVNYCFPLVNATI